MLDMCVRFYLIFYVLCGLLLYKMSAIVSLLVGHSLVLWLNLFIRIAFSFKKIVLNFSGMEKKILMDFVLLLVRVVLIMYLVVCAM